MLQIETACIITTACAVLHNICITSGDTAAPDDAELVAGHNIYEVPAANFHGHTMADGAAVRTALINQRFQYLRFAMFNHIQ